MAKSTPKVDMHEKILKLSIPLFAETGYDGVSMRDVAVAVGLTPAALYYHFSNKEQLYVDTVAYAFREVTDVLKAAIEAAPTPLEQLESIIRVSIKMLANNKPLVRLIQWVKLDSDRQHPKKLATAALNELFSTVQKLVGKLGSGYNASRLLISIASMVVFPFEIENTCQYLSGYQSRNTDPAVLTKHVIQLLRQSLSGMEADSQ